MESLVWQMFILGTGNLDGALKKGLGGVILFSKDIESEIQLFSMISDIKTRALIKPFIAIDQEGGRVERTERLRPKRLSARYAFERGGEFLKQQSEEISKELSQWGFNLNFAPCIDVNTNPDNPIIGERSFSNLPENVIKGAKIFIDASRKYGVIPCVKHFPGHGDADKDSHVTLPMIDLSLDDMEKIHIKPFVSAINDDIEMIMVAHLHCTAFDREVVPSSLSENVIGYLRNKLGYRGVLISDDMVMKGVVGTDSTGYSALETCIKGINAGLDMFIFRNSDDETLNMIENLVKVVEKNPILQEKIKNSNERILKLKKAVNF